MTGGTQHTMFSYRDLEERILANHPLRKLHVVVDEIHATCCRLIRSLLINSRG